MSNSYVVGEKLFVNAQIGDLLLVQHYIQVEHADPNWKNAFGWTALHGASERGNHDIVSFLLEQPNCNPNIKSVHYGWTPLHRASEHGHEDCVHHLLTLREKNSTCRVVDPNQVDSCGETALHLASRKGYPETVKILLTHGANPNLINKSGKTPLQWAIQFGYLDVVQILLPVTNSPRDLIDNSCKTPVSLSRGRENRKTILRLLLINKLQQQKTICT